MDPPPGPVALGSDITYAWQVCNNGARDAAGVTLNASTQVYIIAPIPARTVLEVRSDLPGRHALHDQRALNCATVGDLERSRSSAALQYDAHRVPRGRDAGRGGRAAPQSTWSLRSTPASTLQCRLTKSAMCLARTPLTSTITDQSGDTTPNNGDGNADFNEGYVAGAGTWRNQADHADVRLAQS